MKGRAVWLELLGVKLEHGDGVSREMGNKDMNVKDDGRVIRFLK